MENETINTALALKSSRMQSHQQVHIHQPEHMTGSELTCIHRRLESRKERKSFDRESWGGDNGGSYYQPKTSAAGSFLWLCEWCYVSPKEEEGRRRREQRGDCVRAHATTKVCKPGKLRTVVPVPPPLPQVKFDAISIFHPFSETRFSETRMDPMSDGGKYDN